MLREAWTLSLLLPRSASRVRLDMDPVQSQATVAAAASLFTNRRGDRNCPLVRTPAIIACSPPPPGTSSTKHTQMELPFGGVVMNRVNAPPVAAAKLAPLSVILGGPGLAGGALRVACFCACASGRHGNPRWVVVLDPAPEMPPDLQKLGLAILEPGKTDMNRQSRTTDEFRPDAAEQVVDRDRTFRMTSKTRIDIPRQSNREELSSGARGERNGTEDEPSFVDAARFARTFFCGCRSVCKDFLNFWTCDRVRTFVRPFRAADWRRWPGW